MALGAAARERQEFIKPENVLKRALVKEEEERQAKQKEQERKEAAQKKSDKQLADRQRAEAILRISKEQKIPATEAVKIYAAMGENKEKPQEQTPDVTFASRIPPEQATQEETMSGFARARGEISAGMKAVDAATQKKIEALREQFDEGQEDAKAIADAEMTLAENLETESRALKAMQKAHQQGLDDYQKGTDELESDYKNSKIDPNRAFPSTASRVASAIAIALGAFAQGASRGKIPNTALQIIEGAIKRDIDAQKAEMQKKRDVLLNRNNIYARMMARFNNERVAFHASMELGYKIAKSKIQAMVTKAKSNNALQALNVSLAAMETEQAKHNFQGNKFKAEISVKEAQFQARAATGKAAQTKRSDSILLAQKTLQMLPRAAQQFGDLSAMEGLADALIPDYFQDLFGGMKGVVSYKDTRNLSAKMITKAFDGGRPTEKDFQIFVAMFPSAKAERELGLAKFNNIAMVLNEIVVREGGLKPGALTRAWESQYGENQGLTEKDKAEGKALSDQAKAQTWGFQPGT